jgi:hypothetical protein
MKQGIRKTVFITLALIATVLVATFALRSFLMKQITVKLEEQIQRLRDAGYIVKYDSIKVDWASNTVEVFRLSVTNEIDSTECQNNAFLNAKYISATGFKIIPLLLRRHLSFENIALDSPGITINEKFFRKDSVKREVKEFAIFVDKIDLPSLHVKYYDYRTCEVGSTYLANAAITDFRLAVYNDQPFFVNASSVYGDSIKIELPDESYTLRVKGVTFKPSMGIFDLDTLRIIPQLNKIAFGRKKGFETDRIEGLIPYINLYGLSLAREDSLVIRAHKLTTQLYLKVFRDKRLPFKRIYKNLPIQALNKLPVGVDIKTLVLNKSYVQYEEFAEGADSAGNVFFDNLYATIRDINNTDYDRKGKTILVAEADLMGQAEVKVRATCPWNTRLSQHINGTVTNLDMKRLNRIIEPVIQVRAESGFLKELRFDFATGPSHANGKVELNYNDLKLVTFKDESRIERILKRKKRNGDKSENEDEDDEKVRKAAFKTFIVNTFIVKRKMDKNDPEDERTGTIDFERDPAKSVFNFWWKSVLSGVKGAYNIEKIQESKLTKLLRKKDKGEP